MMDKIIWLPALAITGSLLIFLFVTIFSLVSDDYYECSDVVGIVDDFEVSAGGFANPTIAKVILKDGRKIVMKGSDVYKLREGKEIEMCLNRAGQENFFIKD